jgi:hypothetical protein
MQAYRKHRAQFGAFVAMTLVLPALSGCLWHTRKVPQAVMSTNVLSSAPAQLVEIINKRYESIQSLSADVTFTATSGGALKGSVKTVTPFSGHILLRKPESLRVIGLAPFVRTRLFDMASDGQTFKLWIPPKDEVIEGTNAMSKQSANAFENMRPYIFFDSLLIRKIGPDDWLSMTADNDTEVNPKTKKLEIRPEYLLNVMRQQEDNGHVLLAERVIQFSRLDLRPVEEDIYDKDGQIQTQALYGPLQKFGNQMFPGTITIRRPLEQYQIVITVEKLNVNLPLNDEQFELTGVPDTVKVKKLQ